MADGGSGPLAASLALLHFNDVYEVSANPRAAVAGGIARFATLLKDVRGAAEAAGEEAPLLLFSGDAFSPSVLSTVTRGAHMPPMLNKLGIAAAVLGNHDLDATVEQFVQLREECNFPWLCSNAVDTESGEPLGGCKRLHTVEAAGRRIGIMGLIEREWLETLATVDESQVRYTDFCEAGRALAQELRDAHGADIVVALTHMRLPNDRILSEAVPEIDFVLGGHDHSYAVESHAHSDKSTTGTTWLIKSGNDFRDLTRATLAFSGRAQWTVETEHLQATQDVAEDADMAQMVEAASSDFAARLDNTIGVSAIDLDARFAKIRTQETNIGNFVCDVIRLTAPCDVALLNSGTLRADAVLPEGDFRLRDLVTLLPMADEISVLEMSKAQVVRALENSVSQHPKLEGRFLQVSGLRFRFDPRKEPGARVDAESIEINGSPAEDGKAYRVATKGYLVQGKDGFDVFAECKVLVHGEDLPPLPVMMRNFFAMERVASKWESQARKEMRATDRAVRKLLGRGDEVALLHKYHIRPEVEGRIVDVSSV